MSNLIPLSGVQEYYTPEFKQLLTNLGKFAQTMNIVEMVTPINAGAEKQIWLEQARSGKWTNPVFQYDQGLLASIADIEKQLIILLKMKDAAMRTVSNEEAGRALREIADSRFREIEATVQLARCILDEDDNRARRILWKIYGCPTISVVAEAENFAKLLISNEGKSQQDSVDLKIIRRRLKALELNAEQIRENFIWMAEQCGLNGTRPVEISEVTTAIDVRDKSSRGAVVSIPADRKVDGMKLIKLVGHEILCHWSDSERAAQALPLLGGGALKPADEVLYEGHATLTDYHVGYSLGDKVSSRQSPFYILAMTQARAGMTFAETAAYVYELIRPTKLSDEAAMTQTWTTCLRIFRGSHKSCDNSKHHYAFTKDRAYFEGRLIAEELHDQKLDSILEVSTLSKNDIDVLKTAVQFEQKDHDQARTMLLLWGLVRKLLEEDLG